MTKQELITKAIEEQKHLTFDYNGGARVITPHKLGVKYSVEDRDALRVFGMQYDGKDHEGNVVEGKWRCFRVTLCENIKLTDGDGVFHTEETAGMPNYCMDEVYVEAM